LQPAEYSWSIAPGSWHKVRTLMRFDVHEGKVENLEVIELAKR